jgi:hypothetical protein
LTTIVFSLPTTEKGMISCIECQTNSGDRLGRFSYLDLGIDGPLLIVELIIIVGVHLQVVERELLLDPLLECLAFFEGEGIGLGDDGNNVDNIRELLQNDDINGLEATLEVNWVSAGYSGTDCLGRKTHA